MVSSLPFNAALFTISEAPTAPKKRPSIRTKTSTSKPRSGSGLIARPNEPSTSSSSSFANTKKDKRIIKSSSFLNRIEKSSTKKALKRRRPSKKLVTTLESLGDALPSLVNSENGTGKKVEGKIEMKSLTSGKGSMKRRGKVEAAERERFGRNLAQLMGKQDVLAKAPEGESGAARFKALRNWIGQTMEKEEAFEEKK